MGQILSKPTTASLLSMPNEILLEITSYLSRADQKELALVHSKLAPVAQAHLSNNVLLAPALCKTEIPGLYKVDKLNEPFLLARFFQDLKPGLAKRVTSLRIASWTHVYWDQALKEQRQWNSTPEEREAYAALFSRLLLQGKADPLCMSSHISKASFVGMLLFMLPALKRLSLRLATVRLDPQDPVDYMRNGKHPFAWGVSETLFGTVAFDLDMVPVLNKIEYLDLQGENCYMLQEGSFRNLQAVDVKLPPCWNVDQERTFTPRSPFFGVRSIRLRLDHLLRRREWLEPFDMFLRHFPACTHLEIYLEMDCWEPHKEYRLSRSYEGIVQNLRPVADVLETLIFNYPPNRRALILMAQTWVELNTRSETQPEEAVVGVRPSIHPIKHSLAVFRRLRHLRIPYYALSRGDAQMHNGMELWMTLPPSLEKLEILAPRKYTGFFKFMLQIAQNRHYLPKLKLIIVYIDTSRHNSSYFTPQQWIPELLRQDFFPLGEPLQMTEDQASASFKGTGIQFIRRNMRDLDEQAELSTRGSKIQEIPEKGKRKRKQTSDEGGPMKRLKRVFDRFYH